MPAHRDFQTTVGSENDEAAWTMGELPSARRAGPTTYVNKAQADDGMTFDREHLETLPEELPELTLPQPSLKTANDSSQAYLPALSTSSTKWTGSNTPMDRWSGQSTGTKTVFDYDDMRKAGVTETVTSVPSRSQSFGSTRPTTSRHVTDQSRSNRNIQQMGPFWPMPQGSPDSEVAFSDGEKCKTMPGRDTSYAVKVVYLSLLAKALLCYGAPTHRVEMYMERAAAIIGVDATFFYLPDHFIISFDDGTTHRTETKMVAGNGTDLGRFNDAHEVYKLVNRDALSVENAIVRLEHIEHRKPYYSDWFLILIYGFAAIGIGPFAYQARFVDLPISFGMGTILGLFQLKFIPSNPLYSRVFEISTAIFMSFFGRMIGSFRNHNGDFIFCYSAITQSCINLILPGYWITNAGLELMNHQLAAGGSRMIYALIYYLTLAYGIAMGSALYGFIDLNAVSSPVCSNTMDRRWNLLFVPYFSAMVAIISRAKVRQIPIMVFISFCGYATNFVALDVFNGSFTFATTLGGLVIGILGNVYARVGARLERRIISKLDSFKKSTPCSIPSGRQDHVVDKVDQEAGTGRRSEYFVVAAAAMVPAMIVQVPSGLAAVGAVLSGVTAADAITRNETSNAIVGAPHGELHLNGMPVLLNVVQIAISIGFGLGVAAMIVYPSLGKKRSAVMSW